MLLVLSETNHPTPIFVVELYLPIYLSHFITPFIMWYSVDKQISILIVSQMLAVDYPDLLSFFVVLLVVALFVDLYSVAVLVVLDWVVVLVVLNEISVVVVLFGLPLAFVRLIIGHTLVPF